MRAFFVVEGPLAWLDEDGNGAGSFDAHDYEVHDHLALRHEHHDRVGIGADLADSDVVPRATRRAC